MFKFITKRAVLYTAILLFIVPVLIFVAIGFSAKDKGGNIAENHSGNVPLPSKEDTVRTFCNLINEERIPEAISMMSVADDSEKQAWGVNFNSISSFEVVNINKSSINDSGNSFEIDVNVKLKNGKENYGWVEGINKRWINLVEYEEGKYKIAEIATGP